jgi:hypothetical protein
MQQHCFGMDAFARRSFDILEAVDFCREAHNQLVQRLPEYHRRFVDKRRIKYALPRIWGAQDQQNLCSMLDGRVRELWVLEDDVKFSAGIAAPADVARFMCASSGYRMSCMLAVLLQCDSLSNVCANATLDGCNVETARMVAGRFLGQPSTNPLMVMRDMSKPHGVALMLREDDGYKHWWLQLTLDDGRPMNVDPCGPIMFDKYANNMHDAAYVFDNDPDYASDNVYCVSGTRGDEELERSLLRTIS